MNNRIKRHPKDNRIIFIDKTPTFKGIYNLNKRQVSQISVGPLRKKSDTFIEQKLEGHKERKEKKNHYHLLLKEILIENENNNLFWFIKLSLIEEMISFLRKEKTPIKRKLKKLKKQFVKSDMQVAQ